MKLPYLPAVLLGIVIGTLIGIALHCALAWARGGSADPRCVYNFKGYVEAYGYRPTGISCEYKPEVGRGQK